MVTFSVDVLCYWHKSVDPALRLAGVSAIKAIVGCSRLISPEIATKGTRPFHRTSSPWPEPLLLGRLCRWWAVFCFRHGFYCAVSTTVLCISFRVFIVRFLSESPRVPLSWLCQEDWRSLVGRVVLFYVRFNYAGWMKAQSHGRLWGLVVPYPRVLARG